MNAHDDHLKGSESRLWNLVHQRTCPGADKAAIDARIWDLFGETWAILFTDLAGFSRQTALFGITHFLQIIHEQKRILLPILADHDGILIKMEADGFLMLFRRPAAALGCAIAMQQACQSYNRHKVPEEHVLLCLGIGFGRILKIGDGEVYGAEVNAAAKLGEDTAKVGEILVTAAARDALGEAFGDCRYEPLLEVVPGSARNYRVHYAAG
jgi:adenylate cyclase